MMRHDDDSSDDGEADGSARPRVGKVRFDIGRLTLPGYSVAERSRFTAALQLALEKVVQEGDRTAWSRAEPRSIARLDAGQLRHGASPEEAAVHVAGRVGGVMAGNRGGPSRV